MWQVELCVIRFHLTGDCRVTCPLALVACCVALRDAAQAHTWGEDATTHKALLNVTGS